MIIANSMRSTVLWKDLEMKANSDLRWVKVSIIECVLRLTNYNIRLQKSGESHHSLNPKRR
jgi:hypothetical protein